jgi:hypothetical protein
MRMAHFHEFDDHAVANCDSHDASFPALVAHCGRKSPGKLRHKASRKQTFAFASIRCMYSLVIVVSIFSVLFAHGFLAGQQPTAVNIHNDPGHKAIAHEFQC